MNENNEIQQGNNEQVVVQHGTFYAGPLPSPALLKQFDDVVPGAAERIIKMAEEQEKHRQQLESLVIKNDTLKSLLGTIFGFIIAAGGFGGGLYAAFTGQPFFGGSVSIATLGSVVGVFIYGTKTRERSIKEQAV